VVPLPDSNVVPPPALPSAWDSAAGPALFVAGQSPSEAAVVVATYTDSTSLDTARFDLGYLRTVRVDLFTAGKRVGTARVRTVGSATRSDSCNTWPVAQLLPDTADIAVLPSWSVAFQSGHAAEVALDSIEGVPTADSARLAVDIARLASVLPGDTAAAFRGLPFVVMKAWRSRGVNLQILAAIVVRNVNQEANPLQERLLLIAERDAAAPAARYMPRYHERVTGMEEAIETTDLSAMVLLGTERRPTIVVTRDTGTGSSYTLIERIAGQWQRRWTSAYAGC
jgi:hypothetical protein